MIRVIKVVLENKEKLKELNGYEFVEEFNKLVDYDDEEKSDYLLAVLNNRYGCYSNDGFVHIIDEREGKVLFSYNGYNCSCGRWEYEYFNIVDEILGEMKNHNCDFIDEKGNFKNETIKD